MHIQVLRISTGKESSAGAFYINGKFACFTLEDTRQSKKVPGESRIPDGTYTLKLRKEGGLHKKYSARYGPMHRGMLWLQDIPDFKWVYIHTGNNRDHTEGCLLVGDQLNNNQIKDGMVSHSRDAYKRIYPEIAQALDNGENVTLQISNHA